MALEDVTVRLTLESEKVYYWDSYMGGSPLADHIDHDPLLADTRDWLIRRIEEKREEKREERDLEVANLLGRHLYETILGPTIRPMFENRVRYAKDHDLLLRLELVFEDGTSELAKMPWEFLYTDIEGGNKGFLAGLVEKFTLTRFIAPPLKLHEWPKPIIGPVKVLLAVCVTDRPGDPFTIPEVRGLVTKLTKEAEHSAAKAASVELVKLANPTYDALLSAVNGETGDSPGWIPDIVHVVAEGEPGVVLLQRDPAVVASEQAQADMAADAGRTPRPPVKEERVDAERLRKLFESHQPKLVFLQTCNSAAVDAHAFFSAADSIRHARVPAVLAMQYDIGRGAADSFACRVYERLLRGDAIDVAVGHGRNKLLDSAVSPRSAYRAFGTPVIYLGHGGPLVEPPADSSSSEPPKVVPDEPAGKRECPRCHQTCQFLSCPNCALRFSCRDGCKELYENPLGRICGNCELPINQPPYEPEPPAPRSAPQPPVGLARANPASLLVARVSDWQKLIVTDPLFKPGQEQA